MSNLVARKSGLLIFSVMRMLQNPHNYGGPEPDVVIWSVTISSLLLMCVVYWFIW